jgi:choline kinase
MSAVSTAVILAAGVGSRLRGLYPGLPKPLIPIGGRPMLARSVEALLARGVARVVLVAGHRADLLRDFAAALQAVDVVENADYATTGSMASLATALATIDEDVLVVEGDIVYDPAALDAALGHGAPNVLVTSGPTGAGDEVWVEAPAGRVVGVSKHRDALGSADGELVGVLRISCELGRAMLEEHEQFARANGHRRQSYEEGALVACLPRHQVAMARIPQLLWGEIDDAAHHRRVMQEIWPALSRKLGQVAQPASA